MNKALRTPSAAGAAYKVIEKPFSIKKIRKLTKNGERFLEGVVSVDLSEVVDADLEGFLNILSERLTGSVLLENFSYLAVGAAENTLHIRVCGDARLTLAELA